MKISNTMSVTVTQRLTIAAPNTYQLKNADPWADGSALAACKKDATNDDDTQDVQEAEVGTKGKAKAKAKTIQPPLHCSDDHQSEGACAPARH